MAEYWIPLRTCPEGPQTFACYTTVADVATVNTAGQVTGAPNYLRKGDIVWVMTGCSAVNTVATRAAFTGSAVLRATANAANGAVDLSDNETMADSD